MLEGEITHLINEEKCGIVGNWTCFSFLQNVSPLIQEASSVLTGGEFAGFQTLCGSVLSELLRTV